MHILADDPVGRALPYLKINQQKIHDGSISAQANRSFGPLDTRKVDLSEIARAQVVANRQGISGLGVAVTFLDSGRGYSSPSTWASQGGQGAMTSFDINRPNVIHPSMTRFIPRPQDTVIRAEYQLPVEPESSPSTITAISTRLPDVSPGPQPAQLLQRSWEDLLKLREQKTKECTRLSINGAPSALPASASGVLGEDVPMSWVLAGLVALWLMTPRRK